MVLPVATKLVDLVIKATPAAFLAIDATCSALESELGGVGADFVSDRNEVALRAIIALRTACEFRKRSRRKKKR